MEEVISIDDEAHLGMMIEPRVEKEGLELWVLKFEVWIFLLQIIQPLPSFWVPAFHNFEERCLDLAGDGTWFSLANLPIVHFSDRCYLGGCSSQKGLMGRIELIPRKPFFDERDSLGSGDAHHRVSRDPG